MDQWLKQKFKEKFNFKETEKWKHEDCAEIMKELNLLMKELFE